MGHGQPEILVRAKSQKTRIASPRFAVSDHVIAAVGTPKRLNATGERIALMVLQGQGIPSPRKAAEMDEVEAFAAAEPRQKMPDGCRRDFGLKRDQRVERKDRVIKVANAGSILET